MARQSQDKATTDRFTKTLRELVRRPDNKVCADCKHNDPRWASWNLGVFLCIRCSGVHRGMGTHISKVKSVDLDVWTPEQMENIQKWGNRLANLYWEARLKPGHIPPEHKVESFIRSKYESRRWAMDGPPPQDPSVLDSEPVATEEPDAAHVPPTGTAPPDPIGWSAASPPRSSNSTVNRQPQSRQLLSATHANNVPLMKAPPQQQTAAAAPPPQPKAQDDIFSLDFHAPAIPASPPPKNAKEDILSLFSTSTAAPAMSAVNQYGQFHQQPSLQNHWGAAPVQQPVQPQSMMGTSGAGMWGASSGWTAPQSPQSQNVWGSSSTQQSSFVAPAADTNVWGGMGAGSGGTTDLFSTSFAQSAQQKKDDAFGDLWK